ncbi:MAG TPA: dihydrolipoamide acetyltransferase, partial [Polyangia bacterium]|nr:dihydrolipoamide acetyltransferase [Polyangia bacterium]
MTSQRTVLARGLSGALGVFGLSGFLFAATVHAETAPSAPAPAGKAAAPAPSGGAAPATGSAPASASPAASTAAPATTGAPPAPADAAPAPADGAGAGDSGAYTVRLRSLEKNVNELKEQIFRTKARLNLLKETVLGGVIGASRAYIKHKNEMGSSFRLVKAAYALDGVQIFSKSDDTGRLAEMSDFEIYNGAIQPGSHTLTVVLQYQGNGFGVFSYLKGYHFKVRSSYAFVAGEGKTTGLTVVGYEKGNLTTDMND